MTKLSKFIILFLLISLIAFGLIGGYNYIIVKGLVSEGKRLSAIGNYREAIATLLTAQAKWSLLSDESEIKKDIKNNEILSESSINFEQGKIQYDSQNYSRAIDYFSKVLPDDINYNIAKSYIEISLKKKSDEEKSKNGGTVAGVTSEPNSSSRYVPVTLEATATINYIQPTTSQNKDTFCKNDASLKRIELEERLSNIAKDKNPDWFSFEEAKKKYPGQYTSQYYNDSYFMPIWAENSKYYLDQILAGIKNEGEKFYYQYYNLCLQQ